MYLFKILQQRAPNLFQPSSQTHVLSENFPMLSLWKSSHKDYTGSQIL
jgi:hypothetical protein